MAVETVTLFLLTLPCITSGLLISLKLWWVPVPKPTKYNNPVFLLVSAIPT